MKTHTLILPFLLVATAFLVSCDKQTTTSEKIDQVQAKTAAASEEMKDYTYAQKAEFTARMQTQLAEINAELDQLAAKIERSSDAAKAEAKPRLDALRQQSAKLNQQVEDAKNATESTWESVKTTSRKAYSDLKDGFQQARQWVSEKIAP